MAKKTFPEFKENISISLTPMILKVLLVKEQHPEGKIIFIGQYILKNLKLQEEQLEQMLILF